MPFIDLDSIASAKTATTPAAQQPVTTPVIASPITPTPVVPVVENEVLPEIQPIGQDNSHPLFNKVAEIPTTVPEPVVQSVVTPPALDNMQISSLPLNESTDIASQDTGQLNTPQVEIKPGVQFSTHDTGVREIEGPGFEEHILTPEPSLDTKIANLSSLAANVTPPNETRSVVPEAVKPDEEIVDEITFDKISPASSPVGDESNIVKAQIQVREDKLAVAKPTDALVDVKSLNEKTYFLADYCRQAIEMGASDLHITVGYRAMVRVNGELMPIKSQVITDQDVEAIVTEVLAKRIQKPDIAQMTDIDVAYETQNVRFRVNVFKQRNSLSLAFRLIPGEIKTIDELKLPPLVKEFSKFPQGLILVTGPTGSGKSTTIASILNAVNLNEARHIITIEDPIEYVYPKEKSLIEQRAIFDDAPSWAEALKYVLRQDPDIVSIGEMRDYETVSSAIRIAETGHLVFATLHTNSASQTIDRIIDIFPSHQQNQIRAQLASVLTAVLSQRLVRVSSGGRRVVAELMLGTTGVRSSIRDGKTYLIDNMIQTSAELGMMTMEKALVGLIREGMITTEEAQALSPKPDEILALLSNKYGNI